ncbi:MAG: PQQ-binding-like beta-propeller repeat protein, partial [Bryobacteraceae bacterium]|nr:PQQ-binding-like beta-propeller repeat protein [Bryobacteraceae bacterium]
MPWYRSPAVNWLAALLLPPVGLVLLWIRPTGFAKKILGTAVIGLITLAHLVLLFGLRVEVDGSGTRPIFSFRTPEKQFEEIEKSRTAPEPPSAPAEPAVVAAAAPDPEPKPAAPAKPAPYWTEYRGPLRDGHYRQTGILTTWPAAGLKRLWKIPIGLGYSSMVVADGRLYTIDQRRDKEVIAAYDVNTGRQIWAHAYAAFFQEGMGGDGPRATPTWHEGMLYSMGATGMLKVLDAATGAVKWEKDTLKDNGA